VIWFVSDDLSVVFVGSHFVVNHLKMIQTYSLGTPALQKAAKNDSSFKYENRCSKKKKQKNDMRTGALEKTQRKRRKRPVRKQVLQKSNKKQNNKKLNTTNFQYENKGLSKNKKPSEID